MALGSYYLTVDHAAGLACIILAMLCLAILRRDEKGRSSVPTVGLGSGPFATHIAAFRSVALCEKWIQEGYRKYKARAFAVQVHRQRYIMVSAPQIIGELSRAPESALSGKETVTDILQADYTLPHWRVNHELSVGLIKGRLTRSLPHLFDAAMDEMGAAFTDEVTSKLSGSEWTALPVWKHVSRIVCRTSNRLFVGLPLCRDSEYIDLGVSYAKDVAVSAMLLAQFPSFMKPAVARFLTPIAATHARAERIMVRAVTERIRLTETHGAHWQDKPDDYMQWILESGDTRDKEPVQVMMRILRLNVAAINTTSSVFTFAVFRIAADAERYQKPLREEVHEVLARWGWTCAGMQRLRKLDSFLREVMRFYGIRAVAMDRKAMQDFTFSDGTVIEKGQTVAAALRAIHLDDRVYPHAATFDGFRFYDAGREDDVDDLHLPNRLVATSTEFLTFGTGKHACPGRFWAANEMKAMMAYMLTHYDMHVEREGGAPDPKFFGEAVLADRESRVLLLKRDTPVY